MIRPIGGYLGWEMPAPRGPLHPDATLVLKSARSCLAVLLERERPRRVLVPFYSCDAALEPLARSSADVGFYAVDDDFEIAGGPPPVADGERLLYIDYFGLKSAYARRLADHYGGRLWVDQVQAFFAPPAGPGTPCFNSARKFVGVPDGAYLYAPGEAAAYRRMPLPVNTDYRTRHLALRLAGDAAGGYPTFLENDAAGGGPPRLVSHLGAAMLARIDYDAVARRRRDNYRHVAAALGGHNRLSPALLELGAEAVPFCYPFLPGRLLDRRVLWEQSIFVPTLWAEVVRREGPGYQFEREVASGMLPLPVDQRCEPADLDRMIAAVLDLAGRQNSG